MAKAAVLNIEILATAKEAIDEFDKVKDKASSTHAAMAAAATVAATAIIAGLGDATKAAAEHEQGIAKLEQAYKDAGVSTGDLKSSLEEIDASSRRTGQSAEDNIAAYTKLVAATHDTAKAHEELATAQDLAAFKGISVSDAATAITRANEGNTRSLKEMGIATTDAAGKQLPAAQLMKQLEAAVRGQADAMGNTAAGQMARYKESLDQAKVSIGEALLPVLQAFLNMLQPLFNWLENNNAILRILAPVIAVAAGTILAVVAAMRLWAAIQAVMNVLLSANPIGIVILAIAALIAIVVLVVKHWNDVTAAVNVVWDILKQVGAWILAHWPVIVGAMFGPLGILIGYLASSTNAIHDVIAALEAVGHAVSDALGWLGKLPSSAGSILSKLNPFSLSAPGGGAATPTPLFITVNATPGDDLPQVVYDALRTYQRRHVRPELRPIFGG